MRKTWILKIAFTTMMIVYSVTTLTIPSYALASEITAKFK